MKMKFNIFYTLIVTASLFLSCSPEEWLEETPLSVNQVTTDFDNNQIFDDFTRSAYFNLKSPGDYGVIDYSINRTVLSDVAVRVPFSNNARYDEVYNRDHTADDQSIIVMSYPIDGSFVSLQSANRVINWYEENPEPFEDSYKNMVPHMLGECYFLRAYNHLQMSLIFAPPFSAAPDAPGIIMRTDVSKGATDYKARSVNRVVYNQIIEDLKKAIELLPAEFDNSMPPDYMDRAKKGAAQMLLAKVYYIMGSEYWDEALPLINDLISSDRYPLVPGSELASIFNKIGLGQKVSETIFYTTYYFRNAWRTPRYERHFSKLTNNQSRNFAFSQTILDQIGWNDSTFAQNDLRYQQWATRIKAGSDPTYPDLYDRDYYVWMTKFQPHTSNFVLLRSAELYLMRANMLLASNSAQALEDINTLRDRAGLPALSSLTLRDIENEYLKEMAFEQGSRLLFLQANKLDVPPGDRTGQSAIPYDDPTLVWVYPENETARNPLANEVEGE